MASSSLLIPNKNLVVSKFIDALFIKAGLVLSFVFIAKCISLMQFTKRVSIFVPKLYL